MKYSVLLALILIGSYSFGQTVTKKKTPSVSLENQVKYFKARSNQIEAQLVLEHAQKQLDDSNSILQTLIPQLSKDCGEGFVLQLTPEKDLVCVENKTTGTK